MFQFDDTKGHADEVELEFRTQHRLQIRRGNPEALDVDILRLKAEQLVTDASADQEGPAARPFHQLRNAVDLFGHVTCGP